MSRINLQNTPEREGVVSRAVSFDSNGATLVGRLYLPEDASGPLPAAVVTGASAVPGELTVVALANAVVGVPAEGPRQSGDR